MTTSRENWSNVFLREVCFFQEGPGLRKWQWRVSGIKVINGTNIREDGIFDPSNTDKYIDWDEFTDKYRHFEIKEGDIVVSSSGTLGKVARVTAKHLPMMMNTSVIRFRGLQEKGLADEYLFYWLKSDAFLHQAIGMATGAAQQNFGPTHIKLMKIDLPPIGLQKRVASILSAYDDLIENNTRRIEILEEMARRLYEEWFVHFRFPGHEEVSFKESELGEIPEGWCVKTVAETFQIMGGGTPSKKVPEYWDGGDINWFSPTDLTKSSSAFMEESSSKITELGLKKSSAKMFPEKSVMMTSRATIGVVAINTQPATTNQGFITCLPNDEFPLNLMYHWLKDNVETFISLGTGATFKEISKGTFKEIQLVVPPHDVSRAYEEAVNPMMQQVLLLQRKNANLRAQRDLLLPKLVSGEIDVSDIPMPEDTEVEAA